MRNLFIHIIFFIQISFAQEKMPTAKFLFQKSSEVYAQEKEYAFISHYQMYKNYDSNVVVESYDGEILKYNKQMYFRIKDFEFINFNDMGIQVSKSEKAILVHRQIQKTNLLSPLNLEKYINGYIIKVTSINDSWVCYLTPAKGSQVMANKIVVYIKKSDYTITKQEIYMLPQFQYGNATSRKGLEAPKMMVTFKKRPINPVKDQERTIKMSYVTGTGKQLQVSKRYAGYKLIQG